MPIPPGSRSAVSGLIAALFRVLAPARVGGSVRAAATVAVFAAGAALACTPLAGPFSLSVALLAAAGLTALAAVAVLAAPGRMATAVRAILVSVHLIWIYFVLTLGVQLAWAVPVAARWLAGAAALAALGGAFSPRARFRVPSALPLGIWIAASVIGWSREDGVVRCDDYLAVTASGVSVLVPATEELERCRPGESLRLGHYPRRLWEAPGGDRLVMTAQRGIGRFAPPGRPVADRFGGTICSVPIGGAPSCFGGGKKHAVIDVPQHDRFFVPGWGERFPGGQRGVLQVFPRTGPFFPLLEVYLPENVGDGFYDPVTDIVGLLADEARSMRPVRASDVAILDPVSAPVSPGETRFDPKSGEGVFCFAAGPLRTYQGKAFLSVAFRSRPFSIRSLAPSGSYPLTWLSLVWGCDWDVETRQVYVANASLGFIAIIDYDTGEIVDRIWSGFGVRYVTFDRERRLLHLATFLRGEIFSIDVDSGEEAGRWFAGRFVRQVILTRDRQALLATSNVGVLRIPLDEVDRRRGGLPAAPSQPGS